MGSLPTHPQSAGRANTGLDLTKLDRVVSSLFVQGLAPSTVTAYQSGMRQFLSFCGHFSFTPLPVSETTLCCFVAWMHTRGLSPSSIRQYLSAVRFHQISMGGPDHSMAEMPRLHYLLAAARRLRPAHTRPLRLPITPDILQYLLRQWSIPQCLKTRACYGLRVVLGSSHFFGRENLHAPPCRLTRQLCYHHKTLR